MQNVVGPILVAMAIKFGLFLHKIAYKSTCMAHRPEMFGPTRGANPCCHGINIWHRHGDLVAYQLAVVVDCLCRRLCVADVVGRDAE